MIITELFKDETALKNCYISRKVLNHEAIRAWAEEQGFPSTLPVDDLHVTQLYSKGKFDWSSTTVLEDTLYIEPSSNRHLDMFDGGATVVHFHNDDLTERWQQLIDLGATTSYPDYKSHITISYTGKPRHSVVYKGEIILGPEIWKEINEDWKSQMVEQPFD